ncbi:phospho-sugar mutase [Arthrobacter crystallopoietes]|uniref:Phosphomannomutase n=1 Tax=Crystallibacter crystallopoietes TaxID=37928 RepID=A0A1H0ZC87_9MICC|nr:phosphomannomutase [Arthrobacter crystallopoietes]SDQ25037.1 phosphomannomutase [Arthrobacter crystallopoietes]
MTDSEKDPLASLTAAAEAWMAQDPDPQTVQELRELLERTREEGQAGSAARQELADSFSGRLEFGTAGLRAALGPGPNRMNRVVVRHAAAGLARFLVAKVGTHGRPRAVVGYDARRNSDIFAQETAAIFTESGIETFLLPSALPTPVLAYAVRALECDGGVMVTASHNPPQDNGYKVYLGGRAVADSGRGAQIVAPADGQIAAEIAAFDGLEGIALAEGGWTVLPASGEPDSIEDAYVDAVTALADPRLFPSRRLKIVLTPMHGVGGKTALNVLQRAGFEDVTLVEAQAEPDPLFPTVAFPNPEEPGALDLALELAERIEADIVLANDPDADRAAVAVKWPETGKWGMLRGDDVGALLGTHMAGRLRAQAEMDSANDAVDAAGSSAGFAGEVAGGAGTGSAQSGESSAAGAAGAAGGAVPVFANSIVSSRLLGKIAERHGIAHVQTLTGFKWISRVPGLSYGYEEALGYCVAPDLVKDKDGISAALLVAEYAADSIAKGRDVRDELDELHLAHGIHATDQLSVRVGSLDLLGAMMLRLRENPPSSFGGSPVDSTLDLAEGSADLPPTDGLQYLTRDGSRVIIRPSGTEPKLKCYIEVVQPVDGADELPAMHDKVRGTLETIKEDISDALGL